MARFRTCIRERRCVSLATLLAALLCGSGANADEPAAERVATPRLGQPASAELVARWNLSVYPDGRGLPPGRATAAQGRPIYQARCATAPMAKVAQGERWSGAVR